jgi:RNA recognition motif-containing protein
MNFGSVGVQKGTKDKHPLWSEIQGLLFLKDTSLPQSDSEDDDFEPMEIDNKEATELLFDEAKQWNAVIKKASVTQLAVNIETMYKNRNKIKTALNKTLDVLLKLHLKPEEGRQRRKYIESMKDEDGKDNSSKHTKILTRNKKKYPYCVFTKKKYQ